MTTRTLTVSRTEAGRAVADWLCARLSLPRAAVTKLLHERKVRVAGAPCSNPGWKLRAGQRVEVQLPSSAAAPAVKKQRGPSPIIRHLDDDLIVVDKPAGLTTMRHAEEAAEFGGRARKFLPQTLQDLLPGLIAARTGGKPGQVRAVHRLDKETSGLVVFARTVPAERGLGAQFAQHTVVRRYLALVPGSFKAQTVRTFLVRDRGDGRRGSSAVPGVGKEAVTHFEVVEHLPGYTLLSCRLETGRTHQIRIHLAERGHPVCGEQVYNRPVNGEPAPDPSGTPRLFLHATELGFVHPITNEALHWEMPLPADLRGCLDRLRGGG
jgi:23S rRNA pseudouridine1911/1915/1917 synthase